MEFIKKVIAKTIVKPFKSFPFFGRFRFWCLYWAYRLTGWHIRSKEWDFVLEYLPPLAKWQSVALLDVGCSRNLLCHEIIARGYNLTGVDLELPGFKYPGVFVMADVTKDKIVGTWDFFTCISVLEHIEEGKEKALMNMIGALKVGGRLLLTIPTEEFAQGHDWSGFTYERIMKMFPINCRIIEYTEKAGQICLAVERFI